jgi:raffinose/stachyose/melibiose transport system substrate-binding protein
MTRTKTLSGTAIALILATGGAAWAEDVKINVWSWQAPMAESWDTIFAAYEAANPGIDVVFRGIPGTDYPTVLQTGLSGDGGPDLLMLHPYAAVAPYSRAGQLRAITSADVPELSNFLPEALAAAKIDDQLWGVPFAKQTVQVFYNKKIFSDLGLTPPAKFEDMATIAASVKGAGLIPYAVTGKDSWQLVNVFDGLVGPLYGGADFLNAALAGEKSFTDPAFVAALQAFDDLTPDFPRFVAGVSYTDAQTMFSSGQAAMYPGGAWELGGFRATDPNMDIGVFSVPMPGGGGAAPTWGYEDGAFAISAKAAHPDEALALLRWIATPEFGQVFTDTLAQASSVSGVTPADPVLGEMLANYAANPVPMVWVTDYFGVSAPAPYAALMNAAQSLLADATTPEEAAASIQASVDEWNALKK